MQQNKLLSVQDLIKEADSVSEIEPKILSHGLKLKYPENTPDELEVIKSYQEDLRRLISTERVAKKYDRAQGILCKDGKVKIERKTGKWHSFGTTNYLEPHEALHLIETNRLEVYHESVIVSLEKAYCIFLCDESHLSDRLTKEEYMVYSQFMRFGCNILKHSPEKDTNSSVLEESTATVSVQQVQNDDRNLYAWHYLYKLLGLRKSLPIDDKFNETVFVETKASMDNIMSSIKVRSCKEYDSNTESVAVEVHSGSLSTKRKSDHALKCAIPEKRALLASSTDFNKYNENYALNAFMIGPEFQIFQEIFDKIDVIKLNLADDANDTDNCDTMKFSFDLFSPDPTLSKDRCEQPTYRIVIFSNDVQKIPTSREIIQLFRKQKHKSTIIVINVNEDLSFHAYIYRFTVE